MSFKSTQQMLDAEKGIVALIPSDQVSEDEHLTLIYSYRPQQNMMLMSTVRFIARSWMPLHASIGAWADFGERGDFQVATVISPQIYSLFALMSSFHQSQWDFNPHITAVEGQRRGVGSYVKFDRIGVWHDDQGARINYRIGTGERCS